MTYQQLALFGPMGFARAHADGTVWADQPGDERSILDYMAEEKRAYQERHFEGDSCPQGHGSVTVRPSASYGEIPNREAEHEPCEKCSGTGIYRWGAMVNGVPEKSGPCFACKAKGFQTDADERRNAYYWDHVDLSSLL